MYDRASENYEVVIPSKFEQDIVRMNTVYQLEKFVSWEDHDKRVTNFKKILIEECNEIDDIITHLEYHGYGDDRNAGDVILEARVQLADLLGDIIVYCASEAVRWDIPLPAVLQVIMESNFSKLGADGKPIKDERGKFLKGPNYWKPEPKIREILLAHRCESPTRE